MKRSLSWIALSGLALLLGACSDQYAPVDQAHPADWILAHGSSAGAEGTADDCKACHGADLGGGTLGVACRDCHLEGPPFAVHPASWGNPVIAHLGFAEEVSWTGCATVACHGTDLRGGHGSGETGPSCFTSDAMGCHSDGPQPPSNHRGVDFSDPAEHGPFARGVLGATDELDPESTQLYCRNCHGMPPNDFAGGFVADPAILDADSACAVCHPDAKAHPIPWTGTGGGLPHSSTPEAAWSVGCALCHNVVEDASGPKSGAPSCFVADFEHSNGGFTACHGSGGPGSVPHTLADTWLLPTGSEDESHVSAVIADDTTCLACHDIGGVRPLCVDCHVAVDDPGTIVEVGCWSCHSLPPNGDARPNREGAHQEHAGLTLSTANCSACHAEGGSGSLAHFDEESPANVDIAPSFDAKGLTAVRNEDGTCASVSCHGGQETPQWNTGALDVDTECTSCHQSRNASDQYNSYFSGEHALHLEGEVAFPCTACHNVGTLADHHFTTLDTPDMEGPASGTIGGGPTAIPQGNYDPASGSCTPACHGNESW